MEDEVVEARQCLRPMVWVTEPQRGERAQHQCLAEQQRAGGRQVGLQGDVAGHAGADRVGHPHAALARRLQQPRHPTGPTVGRRAAGDFEGVGVLVVHPPQHDVDRLEPGQGAQPHPATPHGEVGPLHEVVAEEAGQVGVLEVARVAGPGGEDHRAGVAAGRVGRAWRESCGAE